MPFFTPRSVIMRRRGYVYEPASHGYSLLDPQWVPAGTTVSDRKKAYALKVDRTVEVLRKFATIASRKFRARKVYTTKMVEWYRKRAVCPLQFRAGDECWANLMEREDNERAAHIRWLVAMSEDNLRAHWRQEIADLAGRPAAPLMQFMKSIRIMRTARAQRIAEGRQLWLELTFVNVGMSVRLGAPATGGFIVGTTTIEPSRAIVRDWQPASFRAIGVPVRLHNRQVAAPARRGTGRFSALDSDDE